MNAMIVKIFQGFQIFNINISFSFKSNVPIFYNQFASSKSSKLKRMHTVDYQYVKQDGNREGWKV